MKLNLIPKYSIIILLAVCSQIVGCKKFISIDPPIDRVTGEVVYESADLATSAMTGIFASLPGTFDVHDSFSYSTGMISDEFTAISPSYASLYQNDFVVGTYNGLWTNGYSQIIFRCNSLIQGVSNAKTLAESTKALLIGEAKFARAFVYFYLVNSYGDVPLVLSTDIETNAKISRSPKVAIYAQIVNDLKDAQVSLSPNYLNPRLEPDAVERVRPNAAAATALLARVYLYQKMWTEAESEATKVINNSKFELLDPALIFAKNSKETIWALQPNKVANDGPNTTDGKVFLTLNFSGLYRVEISPDILNLMETNDSRKSNWIVIKTVLGNTYHLPFKYKYGIQENGQTPQEQTEYNIVLRIAEQYLIRAEARANQNNLTGALEDLNAIRSRSGLKNSLANSQIEILDAIGRERRVELFAEWGHRWFDLKRTGMIDEVMEKVAPLKIFDGIGGTWESYKALFPIPLSEFIFNQSLRGHQNPGYPEQ